MLARMSTTQCPDCDLAFPSLEEWHLHTLRAHRGPRPERVRQRGSIDLRALQAEMLFHRYQSALEEWRTFIDRFAPAPEKRTPLISDADRERMVRLREQCRHALDAWWTCLSRDHEYVTASDPAVRLEQPGE